MKQIKFKDCEGSIFGGIDLGFSKDQDEAYRKAKGRFLELGQMITKYQEKLDNSILKYKLNDMAVIFKAYTDILNSGYTDNADKLKTAQECLKYYPELQNSIVYIDGFDVFTSHLYSFIEELIKCTDVVIAISSDIDDKCYEIQQKTLKAR